MRADWWVYLGTPCQFPTQRSSGQEFGEKEVTLVAGETDSRLGIRIGIQRMHASAMPQRNTIPRLSQRMRRIGQSSFLSSLSTRSYSEKQPSGLSLEGESFTSIAPTVSDSPREVLFRTSRSRISGRGSSERRGSVKELMYCWSFILTAS